MIRLIALVSALALAQPAVAQKAASSAAKPSAAKPAAAKPAARKPAPPKPGAAAAQPATPSGSCIGVVSALGDRFVVQKIGLMVFGNELKEVPVPSWGLDDLVVARVRAAAGPRVSVKRIGYAKGAFEPYLNPKPFSSAEDNLTAVVKTIAASGGCARYVAVVRFSSAFANTNQTIAGIGALNFGYGNGRTDVFAITGIRVYDGRDFTVLKKGAGGRNSQDGAFQYFNSQVRGPSRELKDFKWPDNPEAVAAAARDTARAVLAESLDKALPELLAP